MYRCIYVLMYKGFTFLITFETATSIWSLKLIFSWRVVLMFSGNMHNLYLSSFGSVLPQRSWYPLQKESEIQNYSAKWAVLDQYHFTVDIIMQTVFLFSEMTALQVSVRPYGCLYVIKHETFAIKLKHWTKYVPYGHTEKNNKNI